MTASRINAITRKNSGTGGSTGGSTVTVLTIAALLALASGGTLVPNGLYEITPTGQLVVATSTTTFAIQGSVIDLPYAARHG
jgi:hypothetical protein